MKEYLELLAIIEKSMGEAGTVSQKELPYGRQFRVDNGGESAVLSVYRGKKGISFVWGGKDGALARAVKMKLSSVTGSGENGAGQAEELRVTGLRVGSDESGKGDFFGPLVVAACLLDEESAQILRADGIKDCKALSDREVLKKDKIIKEKALEYVVLALKPEAYNRRYEELKLQKKNLNDLLASGHWQVLTQVLVRRPECRQAIIDRFSTKSGLSKALTEAYPGITVTEVPRAENDTAVAAASILARAKFLEVMEELAAASGYSLPKGGGNAATETAGIILAAEGRNALRKLVKEHFQNYRRLQ